MATSQHHQHTRTTSMIQTLSRRLWVMTALALSASHGARAEVPCLDLPGCGPYYAWLAANFLAEMEMPTESINLTKFGWHAVYNLSLSINNIDSYQKCHRMRTTTSPQDLEYCVYTLSGGLTPTAPLLTMTTCESMVQYDHCIPVKRFDLAGLADFANETGRDAYLRRCPPGNTTIARAVLKEIGLIISNFTAAPAGFALLSLNVVRSCGDATTPMDAPGPILVLTVLATLMTLALASELAERLAMRRVHVFRRALSGGPTSLNDDVIGHDLGNAIGSFDFGTQHPYEDDGSDAQPLLKDGPDDSESITGFHSYLNQRTLMRVFNPTANLRELFSSSPRRSLAGIDGMKGFSMLWIILGHSTMYGASVGATDPAAPKNFLQDPSNYFTFSALYAVDTFFMLSGQLTAYILTNKFRTMHRAPGAVAFVTFVALRWLRLTPMLAFVLFFDTYVAPAISTGPFWYRLIKESAWCHDYWWSNLLYINNFVPGDFYENCMPWTWYLACDMQFHVLALVVMLLYLRLPRTAVATTMAITVGSMIAGYIVAEEKRLSRNLKPYMDDYYQAPWIRVTPFAMGLLLGIALRETRLRKLRLSDSTAAGAMVLCVGTMIFLFYIQITRYSMTNGYDDPMAGLQDQWTIKDWAAYTSFGRVLFTCALAGISILNSSDNGGVVQGFLTLSFWEPVGKLTYGAYLIHPTVLRVYFYQLTQLYQFTTINQTYTFVATATLAYGFAMVLFLLIELPCSGIISVLFERKRGRNGSRGRAS